MIGFAGWAGAFMHRAIFPADDRRAFCMGTTVAVTGALHEDGLADAVDGLLGGQSRGSVWKS